MQTITIPDWLFAAFQFLDRNWPGILAVLAVAVITSVVTEVIKRKAIKPHYLAKYDVEDAKQLIKKRVAQLLTLLTVGFTTLGYLIVSLQANQTVLSQLPVIGQASIEVIGTATLLYNLRLNKTYQNLAARLHSWSKSSPAPTVEPVSIPDSALDELA